MIALPLRTRLTLWYSFLLALALGVFALVAFVEMRQTRLASIYSEVRNDLEQTRAMIAVTPRSSLQVRFAAHDSDLFQLVAADGSLIFETGAARSMAAPAPDADGTAQTQRAHGVPLRGLSTSFSVGDSGYRLRYWLPVRQYEGAVDRFGVVIMLSIPIVLLVAAGGGIWMSRRALRPLDRI